MATFNFPTPQPLSRTAPQQVDFSRIGQLADSYFDSQDRTMRRDAFRDEQALRKQQREAMTNVARNPDGSVNIEAAAQRLIELGDHAAGAKLLDVHRQQVKAADPLARQKQEAELARTRAQAAYYGRRASGDHATSATERIIDRLMSENPDLTHEEAVSLARRAPQDDTMRRERLSLDAYRNDPSRDLTEWRQFYGLPPQQPGGAQGASVPPAPHHSTPETHRAPSMNPPTRSRVEQFGAPGLGAATPLPSTAHAAALANARKAISQGAPREAVIQRLRAAGIDPAGL